MRPLNLIDIKRNCSPFKKIRPRVNLDKSRIIVIPIKSALRIIFILYIVFSFIFSSVFAPTKGGVRAAQNEEERKALEAQLADLESQISAYETTIQQYQTQGKTLKSEIDRLNVQIKKLNLQIKAINLSLTNIDYQISDTQKQIGETENDIELNKRGLSKILQNLYENEKRGLMTMLLENPKLSDFFGDINNLLAVQDSLRITLEKVVALRERLIDQKEQLGLEREDTAALKAYRDAQKSGIQKTQSDKNNLLKITKGKEAEYQKILTETG